MGKFKDITGQRFGMLTAIKRVGIKNGATFWQCQCGCGKSRQVSLNNLVSGHTTSCGCKHHRSGKDNPKFKDLTGQKFGKTTVIKFIRRNKFGVSIWKCLCECGNIHETGFGNLTNGGTSSCGCKRRRHGKDNPKFKDITGQKFGMLTATEYVGSKRGRTMWRCKCDCGKTSLVNAASLIRESTTSCGCKKHRCGKANPTFVGHEEISGIYWNQIKCSAKSRNISFNITIEQVWNLFLKQGRRCALTGEELTFKKRNKDRNGTASLDRIDSSKGYTKDNCQWVHKKVNQLKWDNTQQELIDWCYKIVKHNPQPTITNS